MKKKQVNISKSGFGDLLEESVFSLPYYQRRYSWQEKNWRDFIESLTNLINDDEEEKTNNSIKFFGNIILQRQSDDDDEYYIIDGQQRLISTSLFFLVVYEILDDDKNGEEWEKRSIREEIKNYLLTTKQEIRINLNNPEDAEDYRHLLKSSFELTNAKGKEESERVKTLISKAKDFVQETIVNELIGEGHSVIKLYKAAKKLYFAVVTLTGNEDEIIQEMFMSLNSTGLNLSISDLLKSLLIKNRNKLKADEVQKIWDEEIIKVITDNSEGTNINSEMNRFLLDFLLGKIWT
ncbi:DUF262 domain-containing protein [endosymbiont GvMRE of Glomus versiforme]|uniref:DUF262 domain-containing protein n=1 Tax=endosymbiont GvMRE of Glomus versiforme TaxID=2039283 RepID=UPI000EE3D253|nr:DUF262 domain-containing protein [endosymbiont GvMRE of Glomus versiforme]RHZ35695.1 hypothetical protein GvMRE_IIg442 [endosymbiont GvMRE of Glomus versiforme]